MQETVPIDGWRERAHILGARLRAWRQCARCDVVLALTALGTLRGLRRRFVSRRAGNAARHGGVVAVCDGGLFGWIRDQVRNNGARSGATVEQRYG